MTMKYIKKALIRGIIPFAIMTGMSLLMKYQGMEPFQIKSTFLAGLIATSVMAASVIYDIESRSLLKQSIIHFLIMLVTVFPCLVVSGWFPLNRTIDYLKIIGIFLLVGAILWSLCYLIFGKLIKKQ